MTMSRVIILLSALTMAFSFNFSQPHLHSRLPPLVNFKGHAFHLRQFRALDEISKQIPQSGAATLSLIDDFRPSCGIRYTFKEFDADATIITFQCGEIEAFNKEAGPILRLNYTGPAGCGFKVLGPTTHLMVLFNSHPISSAILMGIIGLYFLFGAAKLLRLTVALTGFVLGFLFLPVILWSLFTKIPELGIFCFFTGLIGAIASFFQREQAKPIYGFIIIYLYTWALLYALLPLIAWNINIIFGFLGLAIYIFAKFEEHHPNMSFIATCSLTGAHFLLTPIFVWKNDMPFYDEVHSRREMNQEFPAGFILYLGATLSLTVLSILLTKRWVTERSQKCVGIDQSLIMKYGEENAENHHADSTAIEKSILGGALGLRFTSDEAHL